jgi:glycosyltransferase involved in cell wall biosynthesis
MKCLPSSVIVSHPSRVLVSYQSALAMQEAGLLYHYETGFYYKKNNRIWSIVFKVLTKKIAERIERQLLRRSFNSLDLVKTHPLMDIFLTALSRFGCSARIFGTALRIRNEYFDATVARSVRSLRPKAVIAYDSSALKTFKACKKFGALCLLDQVVGHIKSGQEILMEESQRHPEFADSYSNEGLDWVVKRCVDEALMADMIFAPSEYVRDTLIFNGVSSSHIRILPYGVDVERFSPAEKHLEEPFRILFVGQISQRKGVKYLLEAFKNLQLEKAELVLMGDIVGGGEGLKTYEGIFKHIKSVPYSELPQHYQSADIFVYPSLHEGSALAIYEAMASGLPVITTHNSGSVVRDGEEGFILPIRDVEALMEKILLLYQDEDLRYLMGKKARERAEGFTWANYRLRLGDTVRELISRKINN